MTLPRIHIVNTEGVWRQGNPVPSLFNSDFLDRELKAAGYGEWTRIGSEFSALSLQVFVQEGGDENVPRFLISVDTPEKCELVFAESTPALMGVLAQWAPAVQAAQAVPGEDG